MDKPATQTTALILPTASNDSAEVKTLVKQYVFHWPLFILITLLFLGGAFLYLKIQSPIYPVTAALKFINPATNNDRPVNDGSLNQLDPLKNPILVEDEINVIKSKRLIYQVVEDLKLWADYTAKDGIETINLYKKSPIVISFLDTSNELGPEGAELEVEIKSAQSFIIKDGKKVSKLFAFATPLKSSFGRWELKPTSNINKFIGSTIFISIADPDLVADKYQDRIKAETQTKEGAFLNLSLSDNVPARGKDVLNLLIDKYRENSGVQKFNQTQQTLRFINVRIDTLKRNLDSTEKILETYMHQQELTNLPQDAERFRNLKEENTLALKDVNLQLSDLETFANYAKSPSTSVKLPLGKGVLEDESLALLYDKISDLQSEREQKITITPEANPIIVSLDRQIKALKEDFRQKIDIKIRTVKSRLIANKSQLENFNLEVSTSLGKVPTQEKEYNAIKREQETKEALYKTLTAKREELALQYAAIRQDFEVVDDAHAGEKKWPIVPVVYALGLVLGVGFAAAIIYFRKLMKEKITSRSEIEDVAEVQVLADISMNSSNELIVISNSRKNFVIGEQFRMLRNQLSHLLNSTEMGRVTLFTSSVSGEGKSFVSSNLAVTLAYASKKTIILEMDLRKPKVAPMFELEGEYFGISDYLAGEANDLDALIRPTPYKGLDFLGCGTLYPNPSELVERERLDKLIAELKTRYDHIVIDSPPVHIVSDSLSIARVADATLYVVRNNYTRTDELPFIKELNESRRFNKFVVIFNGVNADNAAYYSSYNAYAPGNKKNFAVEIKGLLSRF